MADIFHTKVFDGQTKAKLGTEKNPASVQVQTEKRAKEVRALFEKNGWHYNLTVDKDKPENVADLERLLHPPQPVKAEKTPGPNDPCTCGSGKKFKKCCGK
jgi:SWIM/SEC-C metal-binding protein